MRTLRLLIAVAIVGTAVLATTAVAPADPGGGAAVIKDFGCSIVNLPPAPPATTEDTQAVITPSGNHKITCHFDSENPEGKALKFEGFLCGTFLGLTTDSSYTLSASGKGTLTCQIKG